MAVMSNFGYSAQDVNLARITIGRYKSPIVVSSSHAGGKHPAQNLLRIYSAMISV